MSYFGAILGGIIAVAAVAAWFKWRKAMFGDDVPGLFSPKAKERSQAESLEDFVAAYRRGDVSLNEPSGPVQPASAIAMPAATPAVQARPEPEAVGRRETFLSGATKLAYYVCKTGLRDHHVFAHVQLQALCNGKLDAQLAGAQISLLVCNAGMSIVAAIDVTGPEAPAGDAAKAECLRTLGIRYLKLSPKSLPKPEDIRTLLYRM